MKINFDEIEKNLPINKVGYKSLKEAVVSDIAECNRCNPCIDPCSERYCKKFDWIIERARHYAEVSNVHWTDVLDKWEEDRTYWYMNYYQDSNQPLLDENDKSIFIFENTRELQESIENFEFRCPHCGGISTDAYSCNSGVKCFKGNPDKACDWKVYGLFGDLGKGAKIYVKDLFLVQNTFMPIDWEDKSNDR